MVMILLVAPKKYNNGNNNNQNSKNELNKNEDHSNYSINQILTVDPTEILLPHRFCNTKISHNL